MIRFRVSGYTLSSCSIIFWGTEDVTFMATSANNDVFELNMSAFKLYQDCINYCDEELQTIEMV